MTAPSSLEKAAETQTAGMATFSTAHVEQALFITAIYTGVDIDGSSLGEVAPMISTIEIHEHANVTDLVDVRTSALGS
ncbi:hypothetical protein HQ32_03072 [Prauserella sp. Am3]|nr:hypothetical protein HQ32_03072 [Prauserella sp. Am3]